jgi:DNA repair protein RAD5
LVYYGEERKGFANSLNSFDVVITTYGIISNEFSKGGHLAKAGLYKLRWERIILDEAHYIKGRVIQTAKAVY